jgi:KDO2-lipid IV(A) lauroyltransferase
VPKRSANESHSRLHPRCWPTWLFIGLLRLLALLPPRAGWAVGGALGALAFHLAPSRRRIARINLRLCFPELDERAREQLLRNAFRSVGISLVEIGWSWWGVPKQLSLRFEGEEYLREALAQGRGVLLLGGHYTPVELSGYQFSLLSPGCVALYRPDDNPLLNRFIVEKRTRYCTPVERRNLRAVRRALLDNKVVWLAPDQDFGYRGSVFAPFFGQPTATVTMPTRLAQLNDSPVLFIRHQREGDGYVLALSPLPGFGSDAEADAVQFNTMLEAAIRHHPEQYLWAHQRFKTQPDGRRKLYRKAHR